MTGTRPLPSRARRRPALLVASGLTALVTVLPTAVTADAVAPAALSATGLRTQHLSQALGIDDTTPSLSWRTTARTRSTVQAAYRIQAATSLERLRGGRADLWDSGKVESAVPEAVYAGKELGSRTRVHWRVMLWSGGSGRDSGWSEASVFETGLTRQDDWDGAGWITHPDWELSRRTVTPVVVKVPRTTARYVRLDVTKLGLPLADAFPERSWRVQLGEIDVRDSATGASGLAKGSAVTASETNTLRKTWEPALAVDGLPNSALQTAAGYASAAHTGPDVAGAPVVLTLDMKSAKTFDEVALYPRADVLTEDGRVPNFPVDYSLSASDAPGSGFTRLAEVTGQRPPEPYLPAGLPLFAKDFTLERKVRSARLYVSGLGIHETTLNGEPVGDAVLEPANTDYEERVQYATYDVTKQLSKGANTLAVALGNGMSNVVSTADRYRKLYGNTSDPKLIARLEITLADGSVRTVRSGDDWRTTLGATTSSNWYGGEDYDARRAIPRWDEPGGSRAGWRRATGTAAPGAAGSPAVLSARETEPVRVVETLEGEEVEGAEGSRVFDLGRNIAGWPEITVRAPKGTTVRILPAESLKDGHAFQSISNVGGPLWDSYTTGGTGSETWHPSFSYHGFRYLELKGLPAGATVSVRGKVLRTDNASAGDFTSSDELINGIHSIIRRSIEGNMMSVLTDCPSREKLGWLEQNQLVFPALAGNFDMQAYLRKIMRDMSDAQTEDGLVPSTVPEYTSLPGAYRNDSNWGGAVVLVPWQMYTAYGDKDTLSAYYPQMKAYAAFLERQVVDGILDYGLGDWFTPDRTFPRAVAGTYGYWRVVDALSEISGVLGDEEAAAVYRAKADASAKAVSATYYDTASGTFGGGGQGAEALALDMGAHPAGERERLLGHLVGSIEAAGDHLVLGEISLPAAFRVLSGAGRDDVVHRIATQTTSPSYGYQVRAGNTTLGESWDGGPGQSQNHFMLGAIDSWFTGRLAGIEQAEGSVGYRRLLVDPAVVGDLTSASGSYTTPYGRAATSWQRDGERYRLRVTVPAGSTAEVHVPVGSGRAGATAGARLLRTENGEAVFEVGSGDWTFTSVYTGPADGS
ncbi:family 78 glycoside hydrolase catalytic domain [Streptomyces sp. NBC_00059]|uniref:family 78 glycoside hydrolase catalytic domain n=1 Tax=Streptomyces sp. NBC_00059 TaxID=2975635 RepID=UPI002258C247|nr:family 78 glycoside hydrolase catalytic domain [Streptomyces sp. NBC_00059]MCX5412528.1 glycoside hydrolase family 78 protein [Streptomyces sp. NBC_00059]